MKQIVTIDGNRPVTTSRALSQGCEVEHRAVLQLVRAYVLDLKDVGERSAFEMRKFTTRGRTGEEAILDEPQSIFLITLMKNSRVVVEFKKQLTKDFIRQRRTIERLIAQRQDGEWQNVRKDGKQVYFQKTDVIKEFVEYAFGQGSTNAKRYYENLAKMENKALFFFDQKYPNMREVMTIKQLMQVSTADDVIEKALKNGMERQLHYKDCYKLAKERIEAFADIIGQSPILALTLKQDR